MSSYVVLWLSALTDIAFSMQRLAITTALRDASSILGGRSAPSDETAPTEGGHADSTPPHEGLRTTRRPYVRVASTAVDVLSHPEYFLWTSSAHEEGEHRPPYLSPASISQEPEAPSAVTQYAMAHHLRRLRDVHDSAVSSVYVTWVCGGRGVMV